MILVEGSLYITRSGGLVKILSASFNNKCYPVVGRSSSGVTDIYSKEGRCYISEQSENDIIAEYDPDEDDGAGGVGDKDSGDGGSIYELAPAGVVLSVLYESAENLMTLLKSMAENADGTGVPCLLFLDSGPVFRKVELRDYKMR